MLGFDAALPQFEALGAQVVGVSADHAATLTAWQKTNPVKHMLLSDFRRQMLPSYGAMETNEQSPIFRYAKRAYFIIDDRKSTRLNSSHLVISYAVFCLKKKKK